ncbi:chitodextrinase [Allocatelliglobosispora scoriae]|uniref:Chitodextrinase n=1 Tax=Allocatelliglobosispora scoriae TaxID=643052 RepID=A0A841BLC7_9ACTN|nr:discoidin domain-containing protein [Allocatelliglobosispora scoriae]MBB5869094.1 chitodextrinase [Allocatelliglobosispora scoriae]
MAVSRRKLITSAAAGSALAAVSSTGLVTSTASSAAAASPIGDVVGKITVGYQGWFAAIGDGSPLNGWWHWANNWGQAPSPSNNSVISWPDMREYTRTYPTAFANLNSGQPATLFSHYDQQTIDTHFRWMQENGCDTAALQRFNPVGGEGPIRDAITVKVRTAAEATGRKFYIMYDVTNWTNFQSEIKTDWLNKMSAYTASSAYAKQNGKPVVCIWGFGFNDPGRPFTPAQCLEVLNWFKAQGCYVIGGVPTYWRQGINDSRPGFEQVYRAFHMISPWMVGRTGDLAGLDSFYTNVNTPDQAECNALGIDYQPCVMPGDLSSHHRRHGDFYWRHIYNMVRVGAQGLYVSMFDEYNEGNQIAKSAENASMIPAGTSFVTLDEDGTICSSDYYLRITADGGKMLKGQIPLTAVRPTQPVVGGQPPGDSNLALNKPTSASTSNGGFPSGNAVDGNTGSYWESNNNAFPQWVQVDLGAAATVSRVVLKLPPSWGARTQTLSVQGSTNGSTFSTLAASAGKVFDPASGNTVTITFTAAATRYVRINVTANTGWPAAQLSDLQVFGTTGGGGDTQAPTAPANLTVTGKNQTSVSLSWSASSDNVGVTGYQVRQGGNVVGTTAATSYTVSGLTPATAYTFTVTAQDAAGNTSPASNSANATTDAAPNTNLARGKATSESSHVQSYGSWNAVDGDAGTYWESNNNAFPQWIQVDLGAAASVSRVVLKLPTPTSWATRTQTVAVSTSTDGSSFTNAAGPAGYTFNPSSGNTVTITFSARSARYLRLTFTGNTGWPAGQLSEFEVYAV